MKFARWPLCLLLSLLGLSCLSLTSVGLTHHPVPTTLPTGLTIIGRCFAFATICLLFLYSSELAPTSLRARSLASCCSVAAAGSLIAPFLSKIAPHLPVAPLVVQGLLALLAAILVPALPDTGDRPMPDTVEEAEMMAAPKKKPLNASSDSLDVGYGKCPEFVLVDGLIVSKECPSSSWEGSSDSGRGATEYSVTESGEDSTSHGGTISTLRSSGRTQLLGWGENPSLLSQFKTPELPQFKSMETSSVQGSKMMSSLEASSLSDSWRQTKAEGRGEDRLLPLFSLSNGSKFGSNGSTSSRTNLVSQVNPQRLHKPSNLLTSAVTLQHPSLDSSVVSAEHSILFANGEAAGNNNNNNINSSKDGVIKEILRRKLLALDSDETRL